MASPTLHLMWKEYRTLRALWLAALVLATLYFVVIVLAWGGDHAVEGLIASIIAANLFTSLLFAGIAICMVFTLEAEDRTSLLLFQFAPTWRQMMAGKLTTVFVLAVALLLAAFLADGLVAGLMSLTNAIQIRTWMTAIPWDWDSTKAWNVAVVFAAVVLLIAQTAMCCAFLVRKVIGAVLATLSFLLFVAYPLGISAAEGIGMVGLSLFVVTTSALTGILSVAWHRGLLPYRMPTWAAGEITHGHTESIPPSWSQSARHRIAVTPNLHGWISAVSRQQESRWRMASALLWKEVRSGWVFLLVCSLVGCFVIAMSQLSSHHGFRLMLLCTLGGLYCLECGLRTFRSERSDGSMLFYGHRGTSPFMVWCVKVGFWVTVTLAGLNLVKLLDGYFPIVAHESDGSSSPKLPVGAIPWFLNWMQTTQGWHADAGPNFFHVRSIPLTFILICFVSGLVSTCWIRRSVLSFGFALGLATSLLIALAGCMKNDLPVHRLQWPLLLAWVVTTLVMARSTVELRRSWQLDVARISLLVIPAALAWWAAGIIRIKQVPDFISPRNPVVFGIPATSSPLVPWLKQHNAASPELANGSAHHNSESIQTSANPLSFESFGHDYFLQIKSEFDKLRALRDDEILTGFNQSWRNQVTRYEWHSYRIAETVIDRSREQFKAGQHQEAGRCLTDGIRLIRVLNQVSVSWGEWSENNHGECRLLREIARWSAEDAVSTGDLHATASHLRTLTQKELSPVAMLNNRYNVLLLIQANPSIVDSKNFDFIKFTQWNRLSSTEQARLVRVFRMITAMTLNEFAAGTESMWGVNDSNAVPTETRKLLQRILRSTTDCGLNLAKDPMVLGDLESSEQSSVFHTLRSTTTLERATLLILELQSYRRRFAEFPRSLDVLMSSDWLGEEEPLPADTFVSATGERFGYSSAGAGFSVAIPNDDIIRVIAPNQPLLWSRSHPAAIDSMARKSKDPAFFLESGHSSVFAPQTVPSGSLPSAQWTTNNWSNTINWLLADTKTIHLEW
ncbi:MAG: hypothetical protein R3C17_02115 [Planctomycetaceae bacterium]